MSRRQAIELYAMRAREFSDAVARLGRHQHTFSRQEFLGLLCEINRLHGLCGEAAAEVDRHVSETESAVTEDLLPECHTPNSTEWIERFAKAHHA
jgi:hypothetical protein